MYIDEIPPKNFNSSIQVAACYLEVDSHLLLLECNAAKKEAGRWGVPGGKLEGAERPQDAAKRELFEETKIQVSLSVLKSIGLLYFRKPDLDYVYHLFALTLATRPEVQLSDEHPHYLWAKRRELDSLPLMAGSTTALRKYQAWKEAAKKDTG